LYNFQPSHKFDLQAMDQAVLLRGQLP
jgi:hypothetical protein